MKAAIDLQELEGKTLAFLHPSGDLQHRGTILLKGDPSVRQIVLYQQESYPDPRDLLRKTPNPDNPGRIITPQPADLKYVLESMRPATPEEAILHRADFICDLRD